MRHVNIIEILNSWHCILQKLKNASRLRLQRYSANNIRNEIEQDYPNICFFTFFKGGLRGVVWTDTFQAVIMTTAPIIIVFKVAYDSASKKDSVSTSWNVDLQKIFFE